MPTEFDRNAIVSSFEASIHSADEYITLNYLFVEAPNEEFSRSDFPFLLFDYPYPMSEFWEKEDLVSDRPEAERVLRFLFNTLLTGRPLPPFASSVVPLPEDFLRYLSSEARFPITQSPLEGKTLKEICKGVSPAAIAFLLTDKTPYAAFQVAGGMVLFGLALGLSEGLRHGVRERLIAMITKKRRERAKRKSK